MMLVTTRLWFVLSCKRFINAARMTEFSRRSRIAFERFFAALIDPGRSNGAMLLLLVSYAATWTLYACIARSSQDLHPDMAELISWSRDLASGISSTRHLPLGWYGCGSVYFR